jgi:hypothetical protein
MDAVRFYTLPTVAGWLAAYVTCVALHFGCHLFLFGVPPTVGPALRGYATALMFGGVFIALPTYIFVILPLSLADVFHARRGRPVSLWIYVTSLLAAGGISTAIFAATRMTDIGWASSRLSQMILFFFPFIPYSFVVALAAKHLLPHAVVTQGRPHMITKESPEGQVLLVLWRTIISMSGAVAEQYRWILTGLAAVLGVIIANLSSIQAVVDDAHLKSAICILVASVFLAAIAYLLSATVKVRGEVAIQLEQILSSPQGRSVVSQIQMESVQFQKEMCRPFFGPLRWLMSRAAREGGLDPFHQEKGSITIIVWQAYAMWVSMILAAVSLALLAAGLR